MAKDYIGFTVDLRVMVSVLAQDPLCRAEIMAGLQGEKEALTSQMGAANLGSQEEPRWCSLFPASVQGKESGQEGLFYRNNSRGGAGDRIQMRLKQQVARAPQPAQQQYQVPTPQQAAPQAQPQVSGESQARAAAAEMQRTNPEAFAALLASLNMDQGGGQLSAQTNPQQAQAPAPASNGVEIPSDIAAMLNSGS